MNPADTPDETCESTDSGTPEDDPDSAGTPGDGKATSCSAGVAPIGLLPLLLSFCGLVRRRP